MRAIFLLALVGCSIEQHPPALEFGSGNAIEDASVPFTIDASKIEDAKPEHKTFDVHIFLPLDAGKDATTIDSSKDAETDTNEEIE